MAATRFNDAIFREAAALTSSLERRYPVTLITSFDERSSNGGAFVVNLIEVRRTRQRNGVGTAVMKEITDFTDRLGLPVRLHLRETSNARLTRFFRRFGFTQQQDGWMIRKPARASRGS